MFESILNFFKKFGKSDKKDDNGSKNKAKERLHLVLMQDRANVSADFLEMMKQEIIDVIKKYIEVEENEIDVRLTNEINEDGTTGAPSLYANIPILNIRNDMKKETVHEEKKETPAKDTKVEEKKNEEKKDNKVEKADNAEDDKKEDVEEKTSNDENADNKEEVENKEEEETK